MHRAHPKRVLFVSYLFPPTGGVGVQRVAKFVKYLPEFGWRSSVLTVENRTLTAFLLQSLSVSPMHLKFAGGAALVLPALIFIFAVRKYLFAMWGIANR